MEKTAKNILIVTNCFIDWGGSEELWARSVPHLIGFGYRVIVYKNHINFAHPKFKQLADMGVILKDIKTTLPVHERIIYRSSITLSNAYAEIKKLKPKKAPDQAFIKNLKQYNPAMVMVAQGINFDGLHFAHQCRLMNIPYVVIAQKAVDFFWPDLTDRSFMAHALLKAKQCFFVSQHNRRLTEEQFGTRLPNSMVIFNPVMVAKQVIPFPKTDKGYRLAFVARLFLLDKGQDMLIRILAKPKWKERPLRVSFIGSGDDLDPLRAMAKLLNVTNVEFTGHTDNIESLWHQYHALVLSSRSEGLPLSVVEAMASGRPVIVSNAGGTAEIIEDGVTGFVGGTDEESFERGMERAWDRRMDWEGMGQAAAAHIVSIIPGKPELEFANILNTIINE